MRIVVTQNGSVEIKNIHPTARPLRFKKRKKNVITDVNSANYSDEDNISKQRHVSVQNVTQRKIVIPNEMNERYISDEPQGVQAKKDNLLADVLISINKSIDESSNSKLPIIRQAFPLKHIINAELYQKLQEEAAAESKTQAKDVLVTETKFRSEVFDDIEKEFKTQSKKPISIQNRNLIEYLNTDTTLSRKYMKKLAQYDEERIRKLNKICQKALHLRFQEDIIKNIVQNKIKGVLVKDREFYQHRLTQMKENLKQSHHIVEQDIPKFNKRERYTYQYRQMEKFWSRYNLGRYYKKQANAIPEESQLPLPSLNVIPDQ